MVSGDPERVSGGQTVPTHHVLWIHPSIRKLNATHRSNRFCTGYVCNIEMVEEMTDLRYSSSYPWLVGQILRDQKKFAGWIAKQRQPWKD